MNSVIIWGECKSRLTVRSWRGPHGMLMDNSEAGVGAINIVPCICINQCRIFNPLLPKYNALGVQTDAYRCKKPAVYFQHENDSQRFAEGFIFCSPGDSAKPYTITVNFRVCLAGVSTTATTQRSKPITPMGIDTAEDIRSESRRRLCI